jgi:hypothetical protein
MTLDWTNARAANGPMIADWVDQQGWELDDVSRRRMCDWRRGGQATFDALDRLLLRSDSHPALLPDGVWEEPAPRPHRGAAA